MTTEKRWSVVGLFVCQLIAAAILLMAAGMKLRGGHTDVYIFSMLGMEPFGRYLISAIEFLSAILLLTRSFSALGALLAVGTMLGASIAHVTYLGFHVQGDGGMLVGLLILELVTAGTVLVVRRRSLPFVGMTL